MKYDIEGLKRTTAAVIDDIASDLKSESGIKQITSKSHNIKAVKSVLSELEKMKTCHDIRTPHKNADKMLKNTIKNIFADLEADRLKTYNAGHYISDLNSAKKAMFSLIDACAQSPSMAGRTSYQYHHTNQVKFRNSVMNAVEKTILHEAQSIPIILERERTANLHNFTVEKRHVAAYFPIIPKPAQLPETWRTVIAGNKYTKSESVRTGSQLEPDISMLIVAEQDILYLSDNVDLKEALEAFENVHVMEFRTGDEKRGFENLPFAFDARHRNKNVKIDFKCYWLLTEKEHRYFHHTTPDSWMPFDANLLYAENANYRDYI